MDFNEYFLNGAFLMAITVNDCSFKLNTFKLRKLQGDIPCGSLEVTIVMTGTIALTITGALVLFSIYQFFRFMVYVICRPLFSFSICADIDSIGEGISL